MRLSAYALRLSPTRFRFLGSTLAVNWRLVTGNDLAFNRSFLVIRAFSVYGTQAREIEDLLSRSGDKARSFATTTTTELTTGTRRSARICDDDMYDEAVGRGHVFTRGEVEREHGKLAISIVAFVEWTIELYVGRLSQNRSFWLTYNQESFVIRFYEYFIV